LTCSSRMVYPLRWKEAPTGSCTRCGCAAFVVPPLSPLCTNDGCFHSHELHSSSGTCTKCACLHFKLLVPFAPSCKACRHNGKAHSIEKKEIEGNSEGGNVSIGHVSFAAEPSADRSSHASISILQHQHQRDDHSIRGDDDSTSNPSVNHPPRSSLPIRSTPQRRAPIPPHSSSSSSSHMKRIQQPHVSPSTTLQPSWLSVPAPVDDGSHPLPPQFEGQIRDAFRLATSLPVLRAAEVLLAEEAGNIGGWERPALPDSLQGGIQSRAGEIYPPEEPLFVDALLQAMKKKGVISQYLQRPTLPPAPPTMDPSRYYALLTEVLGERHLHSP
jgi:hypothetical protein